MSADERKAAAARQAVAQILPGMQVGLGTGSTASHAVRALGERVATGLPVLGVATSEETAALARSLGIPLAELDDVDRLDLTIDGADEIDLTTFAVIKGFGGALLREKLVALASDRLLIVADDSKLAAGHLSKHVPVEVVPFGVRHTAAALTRLGCQPTLRQGANGPVVTDGGNLILDCAFGPLTDPAATAQAIKALPGVIEHGLFIGLAETVIIAGATGVQTYQRGVDGAA